MEQSLFAPRPSIRVASPLVFEKIAGCCRRPNPIYVTYGYTGGWWGSYIELLHLRARWYSPGTGTFLSVDPLEGQPPYQYVRGNPVNFTDPSGHIERYEGACDNWVWPLKTRCQIANNSSLGAISLLAAEKFYRDLVWGNRYIGWFTAGALLDHYLDGTAGHTEGNTPGPGEEFLIRDYRGQWVLSTEDDRMARETLIDRFINEHVKPVVASCRAGPVKAHLSEEEIDPPGNTEVKNSLGGHTMQGFFEAWVYGKGDFVADTTVRFFIEDKYDFNDQAVIDKGPLDFIGVGTVPHVWLVDLAKNNWAAEFQVMVEWDEHLFIDQSTSSTDFKVE